MADHQTRPRRHPNVFLSARELIDRGRCPFLDGSFQIKTDEPCPICGALGTNSEDADDKCVG